MFFRKSKHHAARVITPGSVNVSDARVRERIVFLGITPEDLGVIAAWRNECAAAIDPLVDAFYGHIRTYPEAWRYIEKHSSVERQRPMIRRYILTMFEGRIDDPYVQYRQRVGVVHDNIDLDGSLYVARYDVIRRQLANAVAAGGASPGEARRFEVAFNRLIDLDIALVTTALMQSRQGKIREASHGAAQRFVEAIAGSLEQLANRDLTVRLPSGLPEEFRPVVGSFDRAVGNMRETISEIAAVAEQVADASGQISSGSTDLAHAASDQSSSMHVVGRTLHDLAGTTERTAASATEATKLSEEGQRAVAESDEVMQRLGGAMSKIRESAAQTAKIVKSIDEIAFQTNLLALNAAVEAARAGDAGRGFAVVAEEVRALALRSAQAAKNTAELLEQARTHSAEGVTLGAEVGTHLGEIRRHVVQLHDVMTAVNADVHGQRDQIRGIERALDEVERVTQRMAANAEEGSASAVELSSQAVNMRDQVARFELDGRSGARRAPERRPRLRAM